MTQGEVAAGFTLHRLAKIGAEVVVIADKAVLLPPVTGGEHLSLLRHQIDGIRPQDLVGAICGETDLQGRQIGAIEITDNFSLVEVPSGSAEQVIKALGNTTIKGRKTSVRRERF